MNHFEEEYYPTENISGNPGETIVLGNPVYTGEQEFALALLDHTLADPQGVIPSVYLNTGYTEINAYPVVLTPESLHTGQIYYPMTGAPLFDDYGNPFGSISLSVSDDNHWVGFLHDEHGDVLFADQEEEATFFRLQSLKGIEVARMAFNTGENPFMIAEKRAQERVSAIGALTELMKEGLAVQPEVLQLIRDGKIKHDWNLGLRFRNPLDFVFKGDFLAGKFEEFQIRTGLDLGVDLSRNSGLPKRDVEVEYKEAEWKYVNQADAIVPMDERTRITKNNKGAKATGPALFVSVNQQFTMGASSITVKGHSSTR